MNSQLRTVESRLDREWRENGGHATKEAILDNIPHIIGSYHTYRDIEGLYMAVYSFWEHNIADIDIVENDKWYGIILTTESEFYGNGRTYKEIKLYVPRWVMKLGCRIR